MSDVDQSPRFLDSNCPLDERVADLMGRMTLPEKCNQLLHDAPAIERLGVPAYNWWNEALHGVARAGKATVFPQAIGLAASFDRDLLHRVATAISDEARAKYHESRRLGSDKQYLGLTMWSPNINIFRDPRWGRGHETYGEDPLLTAELGVAFIKGMQGDKAGRLKVAACAKHFAVHSGPETDRHHFDAVVSPKDLYETYLPAFRAAVEQADVEAVMGAYNRTNGEPCCASNRLLQEILREDWAFQGHVVSDCWALRDIHEHHRLTTDDAESAAMSLKNGCDLNCGCVYEHLDEALARGLIDETDVDRSLERILRARFRLGMFDPETVDPYAQIPADVVDSPRHRELAREAAKKSVVLLKNNGVLPLSRDIQSILITGPNAANHDVLLANYNGLSGNLVTPLEGIVDRVSAGTKVNFFEGCGVVGDSTAGFGTVMAYTEDAEVIVAVMGLSPRIEGEEGDVADSDGGGDRLKIDLPGVQEELLKQLHETGKPIVLVLANGSAVAVNWAQDYVDAIVTMWYPGEEGGHALADVLFGEYNPSGRLPLTFHRSLDQLPPFDDYAMAGRTYRYLESAPLYPFGFGLSYTQFRYEQPTVSLAQLTSEESTTVSVTVNNVGSHNGDELVQLYMTDLEASVTTPRYQLLDFQRIYVPAGEQATVTFNVAATALALVNDLGEHVLEPGAFRLWLGGCSPGERGQELGAAAHCTLDIEVT